MAENSPIYLTKYIGLFGAVVVSFWKKNAVTVNYFTVNPLRPNNDVSQTSHCNIKGVSVSEVMRIENMITQVQCY